MTKREAVKALRNLLIDHRSKIIHLPLTVLSDKAQEAVRALQDRGYTCTNGWGS